jgi:hypothetical protein
MAAHAFLALAAASLLAVLAFTVLAILAPYLEENRWPNLGLAAGMVMLFSWGLAGVCLRTAAMREDVERALRILRDDLAAALRGDPDPRVALVAVLPAIGRLRRTAAAAPGIPVEILDLADLVLLEDGAPERALPILRQLQAALTGGARRGGSP